MLAIIAQETAVHVLPNWTLGVQLCIFLVAVALLNLLIFGPVLKVMDRRRELTAEAAAQAQNLNQEAEGLEARRTEVLSRALAETHAWRAKRIVDTQLAAERIVAEARLEAQWFLETTEMFIQSSEESIVEAMNTKADELAETIVRQAVDG